MIKLNVSEFAQKVGISRRTLYRYMQKGVIKPRISSLNGTRFFTEEDVLKFKHDEEYECQQNIQN